MPRLLSRRAATALGAMLAISAVPASASDYFNSCQVSGDRFVIDDDALLAKVEGERKPIEFQKLSETVLSEKKGYCLARGKRYEHEARTTVLRIRFSYEGQTKELDALCELATDGLPAAFKCERQVTTRDFKIGGGKPATGRPDGSAIWVHNGSLLRLEMDGDTRRFLYELPRTGMVQAGAKPGDVVLEVRRAGATFTGQAFVYSRTCGRTGYLVSGRAGTSEGRIVVEGKVPRHGDDCKPRSFWRDRLQFDLVPR